MNARMITRITAIAAFNTAVFVIVIFLSGTSQTAAWTANDGVAQVASRTRPPLGTGLDVSKPLIGGVSFTQRSGSPTVPPSAVNNQASNQQSAPVSAKITRTPPLINGRTATPTPKTCEFESEDPIPFFNPDDCRMNPRAGDRIAVYCDWYFREISVMGITNLGQGFVLTIFDYDELVLAGRNGLVAKLGANGIVTAHVDSRNNFNVAWRGGPYGATGQGDFAKAFFCDINQTPPPSSTPRPTRTKVPVPVYTVTPTSTFTPTPLTSK